MQSHYCATKGAVNQIGVDNLEQAYARSGGEDGRLIAKPLSSQKNETNSDSSAETIGNTGYSAGIAALEMISYIKTP